MMFRFKSHLLKTSRSPGILPQVLSGTRLPAKKGAGFPDGIGPCQDYSCTNTQPPTEVPVADPTTSPAAPGRFRAAAVLVVGVALSLVGFFLARDAHHRQVEAQFHEAARDRAESVAQGLR